MSREVSNRFQQRGIKPLPDLRQVQNQVKRSRGSVEAPFTDVKLRSYCEKSSAVPDEVDKAYVFGYAVNSPTDFFFAWSSPKLLEAQASSGLLQVGSCKVKHETRY